MSTPSGHDVHPAGKLIFKIFSPSHIKLTTNNPHKDFKSVERP